MHTKLKTKTTSAVKPKAVSAGKTRTMPAGVFKARCLAVMDEVQKKRESVVITKHGKPVAKLVPVGPPEDDFFGFWKGKARIVGDIVSPVFPLEDWEFLK